MSALRPVIQSETTGCGIASVAAVAGRTYRQTKRIARRFGIDARDARLWSETAYVRRLLEHFGFRAGRGEQPFRSWDALPELALLAIKWHLEKGRPFWHWVVFVRGADGPCVLDSKKALRRHRRADFGRIKPKWFIELKRPK